MSSTNELLENIRGKDSIKSIETFNKLISEKIENYLQERKKELAADLFNKKEETTEA